MYILGVSAFYHDSAAVILKDGKIIAAAQEERFTRIKHDPRFPKNAIAYCLDEAGVTIKDISYISFYENPSLKLDRLLKTYISYAPRGILSYLTAIPSWLTQKYRVESIIKNQLQYGGPIYTPTHHQSHAASAFFPSPFSSSAFLTLDGVGEWTTTSFGVGRGNKLNMLSEIKFPHSLGMLYSAFTYYAGFKVNSGEYKLMGLAPYGDPKYTDLIYKHLIDVKDDGSFRLNMEFFNYPVGFTMTTDRFHKLFGRGPRTPESALSQLDMDMAASIQKVTEEIVLKIARHIHTVTKEKNLCMAGGVALNCVANAKILENGPFENLWVQPASGDAGGALGAAFYVWYQVLENKRKALSHDTQYGSYLGPSYKSSAIQSYLDEHKIPYQKLTDSQLPKKTSQLLARENVIAWFQGRMEYGPRALGNRSILGDPRSSKMQSVMNLKIKFRESFRPFAPSVLIEKAHEWFSLVNHTGKKATSPYMLLTARVLNSKQKKLTVTQKNAKGLEKLRITRSDIPAVTHIDYSARVQTVDKETNPLFHALITAFYKETTCPVLINTSFNVRGEPIVESPQDAYRCFMRTNIDYLVLGNFLLEKKKQPVWQEKKDWKKEFALD